MGAPEHRQAGESQVARCAIFVISDSKDAAQDVSGKAALELLSKGGHDVVDLRVVKNDPRLILAAIQGASSSSGVADLIITTGGTGISKKDVTVETVLPLLVKQLPGFGEMFRAASMKTIGIAAIMSRAVLGVTEARKLVCCLPGSPDAVRTGLAQILLPELKHLLAELRKQ